MSEIANIQEIIEDNPIITAVKDQDGLESCLQTDSGVVFILFGDICNISEIVKKVKSAGKIAVIHMDLLGGIGSKEVAVDFIKKQTEADGIISTKPALLKRAKELGMFTVLRSFILDSMSFNGIRRQYDQVKPDMVEILPGIMPKITEKIVKQIPVPVICGGLISEKEDIIRALNAGAAAISSTNSNIWEL
ncbi:MAG: glycerol-3-phosphate responsive antiterminator [Blautia sp.]|nr:glycerol-3-phosphate responsive antiterminator [Blautia sp.]MDY3998672.1 glycerol-3-phosphate responsive antiterminator [Blautia sp.]